MKQILLTGATGTLGQQVAKALAAETNIALRLMRHRVPPASFSQIAAQWVQADVLSGEGLHDAVCGIDVIVHCAGGIGRLLEAARAAKVSHLVSISIVGCDRIPLFYYRQKVAEEEAIKTSGIPFSILRATQFHALIDRLLRTGSRLPGITFLPPGLRAQSIAEGEVGRRLADLALASPTGAIQEMGGPQVLSLGEMAHTWFTLRQVRRAVLPLWIPGKVAAGYRRGDTTCGIEGLHGEITWAQWVEWTYQGGPPAQEHTIHKGEEKCKKTQSL